MHFLACDDFQNRGLRKESELARGRNWRCAVGGTPNPGAGRYLRGAADDLDGGTVCHAVNDSFP